MVERQADDPRPTVRTGPWRYSTQRLADGDTVKPSASPMAGVIEQAWKHGYRHAMRQVAWWAVSAICLAAIVYGVLR